MFYKYLFVVFFVLVCLGCGKEDKTFRLKTVQLNHYTKQLETDELIFFKILDNQDFVQLAVTGKYPNIYALPTQFAIEPVLSLKLYADGVRIELWGEKSGVIGSCIVNMEDYKIIFPIEMEAESEDLKVSISGTWE